MKLTILGSGTAASQLPKIPNRFPPAFVLEWQKQKVLFDCSEAVRFHLQQAGFDYSDIHHVAISHLHPDHVAIVQFIHGLYCKGIWGGKKNPRLSVYGPGQLKTDFPKLWRIHFPDLKTYHWPFPKIKFYELPGKTIRVGNGRLTAKKVYHGFGRIQALAFRLAAAEGVFVYSGDSGDCKAIRQIAKGADVFVCEASAKVGDFKNPYGYGHLNPFLAGEIAKQGKVKKLVLFHYTGLDSDFAIVKDCRRSGFKGQVIVAKDFQTIKI